MKDTDTTASSRHTITSDAPSSHTIADNTASELIPVEADAVTDEITELGKEVNSANEQYISFAQHMDARRPLTTAVETAADIEGNLNDLHYCLICFFSHPLLFQPISCQQHQHK